MKSRLILNQQLSQFALLIGLHTKNENSEKNFPCLFPNIQASRNFKLVFFFAPLNKRLYTETLFKAED